MPSEEQVCGIIIIINSDIIVIHKDVIGLSVGVPCLMICISINEKMMLEIPISLLLMLV